MPFFASGMVHPLRTCPDYMAVSAPLTLSPVPTPFSMSLVVRRFHRMQTGIACSKPTRVIWTRGPTSPREAKPCAETEGQRRVVGGDDDGSGEIVIRTLVLLPWNRTLGSFSTTSRAVLVISFPTMFFFLILSSGHGGRSASSRCLRHHAIWLPGNHLLCHPAFFFPKTCPETTTPSVSVVCGLLILISHTRPPLLNFLFTVTAVPYGIARGMSPLPPRLIRIAHLLGPPRAILLYSDPAASPPLMPRVHIM